MNPKSTALAIAGTALLAAALGACGSTQDATVAPPASTSASTSASPASACTDYVPAGRGGTMQLSPTGLTCAAAKQIVESAIFIDNAVCETQTPLSGDDAGWSCSSTNVGNSNALTTFTNGKQTIAVSGYPMLPWPSPTASPSPQPTCPDYLPAGRGGTMAINITDSTTCQQAKTILDQAVLIDQLTCATPMSLSGNNSAWKCSSNEAKLVTFTNGASTFTVTGYDMLPEAAPAK